MKTFEPHEVKLANEIAETLKDRDSIALFLTFARTYNEKFLKETLAKVMSIDEAKIRRTRGDYSHSWSINMDDTVILGLSLNTRMLGLAVISGNRLVDYHIQLRKEAWTPRKGEVILTSLQPWCERYSITNVVLSIPYEKQTSSQTKELFESLKRHFSEKKIRLFSYATKTLFAFCTEAKTKKKQ